MLALKRDGTTLDQLLDSFKSTEPSASIIRMPPRQNMKMSINTRENSSNVNRNKRTVKTVRCSGKLKNKNGRLVPEVVCSTDKIQLPQQEQNRDSLLQEILGEVKKSKEHDKSPFGKTSPLSLMMGSKPASMGCKSRKRKPRIALSSFENAGANTNANNNGNALQGNALQGNALPDNNLQGNELPDNALQGNALQGNALPDNDLQGNALPGNNLPRNAPKKPNSGRSKKGKGKGKGKKYRTVQVKVGSRKPSIPKVNVVRKKKRKKRKTKKKTLVNANNNRDNSGNNSGNNSRNNSGNN